MLKNGNKSAHGGKRKNAGRKPEAQTLALRKLQEEKVDDAEYGFALLAGWMRDQSLDKNFRRGCAIVVMDRVWGKGSGEARWNLNVDVSKLDEQQLERLARGDDPAIVLASASGAGTAAPATSNPSQTALDAAG